VSAYTVVQVRDMSAYTVVQVRDMSAYTVVQVRDVCQLTLWCKTSFQSPHLLTLSFVLVEHKPYAEGVCD